MKNRLTHHNSKEEINNEKVSLQFARVWIGFRCVAELTTDE